MAYTNGGQTIDKSMNGLLNFTGDTVTADNIICNTLDVNSSATFDGTATFNSNLPTSTITTTTSNSQFITKAIGDVLYAGGSLLPSNNIWTGTNRFDAELKTTSNTLIDPTNGLQFDTSNNANYGISRNTTTNNMLIYNTNNTGTIEFSVGGLSIIKMSKTFPAGTISEVLMTGVTLRVKNIDGYAGGTGTIFSNQIDSYSRFGFGNQPSFIRIISPVPTEGDVTFENTLTTSIVRRWGFNFDTVTKFQITPTLSTFYDAVTFSTVPTSAATGTPTGTQIAPVNMLNNLYAAVVTGGYARLSAVANAFTNNNSFDSFLPTSVLTGTPAATDIAPVAMLNNLYARLSTVANAFTNNNSFDSFLPTSTISTSSSVNELINRTIANLYYGQITTGVSNTWLSTNNFQNSTASASLNVTQNESVPTFSPLLKLTNLQTPQSIIFFLLNAIAGSANTCVQAGDAVMYSNPTPLVLTIAQTGGTGVRITSSDVVLSSSSQVGVKNGITTTTSTPAFYIGNSETSISYLSFLLNAFATSVNPNVATGDDVIYSNGGILNLCTSSATAVGIRISATDIQTRAATTTLTGTTLNNDIVTTNLGGTTTNVSSNNLAISTSTATTFVNLPSTTTTFTSAGSNDFITKSIGDTLYIPSGGYARLTTVANAFTNNNSFDSFLPTSTLTTTSSTSQIAPIAVLDTLYAAKVTDGYARLTTIDNLFTNSNTFQGTTVSLKSTNNLVVANTSAATANPTLSIRTLDAVRSIKFIAYSTAASLNPVVIANSAVIAGSGTLVLTAQSAGTSVGISINDIGYVKVAGQVMEVNTVTNSFLNPIKFSYTTTPTFVDFQIGYNIAPVGTSIFAPTANTLYQGNSFTLTRGVWLVKGFTAIYSTINQSRVYMSLTTSTLAHDVGNRTFCYNNAGAITVNSFELCKVVVVPTAGQLFYLMVSSNLATGINPTYFVQYQATRIA
jgi:hypothetical protein